jgi:hypothetical protein
MRGSCYDVTRQGEYPYCEYQKDRISIVGTRNLNGAKCSCIVVSCVWVQTVIETEVAQNSMETLSADTHVGCHVKLSDVNEN